MKFGLVSYNNPPEVLRLPKMVTTTNDQLLPLTNKKAWRFDRVGRETFKLKQEIERDDCEMMIVTDDDVVCFGSHQRMRMTIDL